jgi:TonB family protein
MLKRSLLAVALMVAGVAAAAETPQSPAAQSPTDKEVLESPIYSAAPRYPNAAIDELIEGVVTLELVVGLDGSVVKAHVIKEEPPGWDFGAAALAAVKKWKYKPAGREVTFKVDMTFELPADFKEKMRRLRGR